MRIKSIFLLLFLLMIPCSVFSQKHHHDKEEMRKEFREYKTKYIANEIDLKSELYKEFADLYGQMENEKHAVYVSTRQLKSSLKNDKNVSDEDYAKASEALSQCKVKCGEIEKKYDEKFAKILTNRQIYQMRQAEESFFKKLRQMRKSKKK